MKESIKQYKAVLDVAHIFEESEYCRKKTISHNINNI